MRHIIVSIVALFALVSSAVAQQQAPAPLLQDKPYILGPAALQKYPAQTYFFVTTQASQKTMPEIMKPLITKLLATAKTGGVQIAGPIVMVYHGLTPNPETPFDVEAGFIVDATTKAVGEAEVRKLDAFTCATMVFTGSTTNVAKAYEALFPALMAAGKAPAPEMRQMLLYFESETSTNNIMLIQVGVQ